MSTRRRGQGKPFQPGNQYGKGRPAGSRNQATILMEALLDDEGDAIMRKAIDLAKAGNETALRLCVDRLLPPRRDRTVQLTLPSEITTGQDTENAVAAILNAAGAGAITPAEAVQLATVVESRRKTIETREVERRLAEVERFLKASKSPGAAEQTDEGDPQTS
jgi:hypothetical protein